MSVSMSRFSTGNRSSQGILPITEARFNHRTVIPISRELLRADQFNDLFSGVLANVGKAGNWS